MGRSKRKEGDEEATFTMVYDAMAKKWGLVTAAVYGVVHRYCLLRDGNCYASTRRIGELIGLSHYTVQRELKFLAEMGFIEDLTPGRRNRPHVYIDWFIDDPPPRVMKGKEAKGTQPPPVPPEYE